MPNRNFTDTVKHVLNGHSKRRPRISFQEREHSAIFSSFRAGQLDWIFLIGLVEKFHLYQLIHVVKLCKIRVVARNKSGAVFQATFRYPAH